MVLAFAGVAGGRKETDALHGTAIPDRGHRTGRTAGHPDFLTGCGYAKAALACRCMMGLAPLPNYPERQEMNPLGTGNAMIWVLFEVR